MRAHYRQSQGRMHPGLEFWTENGPGQLKRYRLLAELAINNGLSGVRVLESFPYLVQYAMNRYVPGVHYMIRVRQSLGLNKA
jgi:hypothetical protein